MATADYSRVLSSAEARESLGRTLDRFRHDTDAVPVVFGAQRKPEAVVLPFGQYQRLLAISEDQAIAQLVRERTTAGVEGSFDALLDEMGMGELKA